jgi:hypothetical protein
MIEDAEPDEGLPRFLGPSKSPRFEGVGPGGASGRDLRAARSERLGQDDDDQAIAGPALSDQRAGLVFGKEATDVAKNERIGYLPEESYLYKFLNAEETLDFYGRLFDMPAEVRRERINELIEMVNLGWARRRQLKEYSKGMRAASDWPRR